VRAALNSLRALVFGETWLIPAGVGGTLVAALLARAALPDDVWEDAGGFIIATFVVGVLALSLRPARRDP
jgi:hypothetical protein